MLYVAAFIALTWVVFMPLYFRLKAGGGLGLALVFKAIPTAMAAAFAGWAVFFDPAADVYARLVFAGLCICVAADVILAIRFEIGGALFFIGHVLYVLALSLYRPVSWWCLTAFFAAALIMEYFLKHYEKEVPTPLLLTGLRIYAAALAALLGFSLPLPFLAYSSRALLAALGAAFFVASDLTLCHNTIRSKPDSWHYVSLGIYYTAQLLLGLSALHIS